MDRGNRSWPGGPVSPAPYPHERMGAKFPPHEIGQHWGKREEKLLVLVEGELDAPFYSDVLVTMSCPDARLASMLTVLFVPRIPGTGNQTFWNTTIHLTSAVSAGGGEQDVEDLIGTLAAPAPFPEPGLWGIRYSPTEEVEAMRAHLHLGQASGSRPGVWKAVAQWQAREPMTEIEWRMASSLCLLTSQTTTPHIGHVVPG